jgi:hypothetical protein
MIDYLTTQTQATQLISQFGQSVAFSRAGTRLFSTFAVFGTSKTAAETASQDRYSFTTIVGNVTAYIPGNVSVVPLPSDNVVGSNRSYNVLSVEAYNPAGTTIAYKLELQ